MNEFLKSCAVSWSVRVAIVLAGMAAFAGSASVLGRTDQSAQVAPASPNSTACTCIGDVLVRVGNLSIKENRRQALLKTLRQARNRIAICHAISAGQRLAQFVRQMQKLVSMGLMDQATADSLAACARNVGLCGIDCDASTGNQPPVALAKPLVLPADSQCQANPPASQFDNGSFDRDGIIVGRSVTPPGPYPVGETFVTYTVVDNGGAFSSASTSVRVQDTTGPNVSNFAPNFLVFVTPGQTGGRAIFPEPTVGDTCSGVASVNFTPSSGSVFPLGVTPAVLTMVNGAGYTNHVAFNVVVLANSGNGNNLPPVAIARTVTNAADANCQSVVTVDQLDNNSFDADGSIVSRTVQPAGPFPVGSVTPVTLTVVDNQGGTNSAVSTVTVLDLTPPSLAVPPVDIAVTPAPGQKSVVVNFPTLSVNDACSPGSVGVKYAPPSGTVFGAGTNAVTCAVFDGAGNTNSIVFHVIVTVFDPGACDTIPGLIQRVEAIPLTGNFTGGRRNGMVKKLQSAQLNVTLKRLTSARDLMGGFILSCSIYQDLDVLDFATASDLIICATNIQNSLR